MKATIFDGGLQKIVTATEGGSKTLRLSQEVAEELACHGADVSIVRLADLDLPNDKGDTPYSVVKQFLLDGVQASDLVIFATPIWWNNHSSLIQRLIEYLDDANDIDLESPDAPSSFEGKHFAALIVGAEDGMQAVAGNLLNFAGWVGFSIPAYPYVGWTHHAWEDIAPQMRRAVDSWVRACGVERPSRVAPAIAEPVNRLVEASAGVGGNGFHKATSGKGRHATKAWEPRKRALSGQKQIADEDLSMDAYEAHLDQGGSQGKSLIPYVGPHGAIISKSWVPYEGPRGGHGYENTETQEIIYGEMPDGGKPHPDSQQKLPPQAVVAMIQQHREAIDSRVTATHGKDRSAYEAAEAKRKPLEKAIGRSFSHIDSPVIKPEDPSAGGKQFKDLGNGYWLQADANGKGASLALPGLVRSHFPDGIPGYDSPKDIQASRAQREQFTAEVGASFPEDFAQAQKTAIVHMRPDDAAFQQLAIFPDHSWLVAVEEGPAGKKAMSRMRRDSAEEDEHRPDSLGGWGDGADTLYHQLTSDPIRFHVRSGGSEKQPAVKAINSEVGVGYDPMRGEFRLFDLADLADREESLQAKIEARQQKGDSDLSMDAYEAHLDRGGSRGKTLNPRRRITKGRGEPCKRGEAAARSGCIPKKKPTGRDQQGGNGKAEKQPQQKDGGQTESKEPKRKATPEEVHQGIQQILADPSTLTPEGVQHAKEAMLTLTVKEMHAVKSNLGIKGLQGTAKGKLADAILERAQAQTGQQATTSSGPDLGYEKKIGDWQEGGKSYSIGVVKNEFKLVDGSTHEGVNWAVHDTGTGEVVDQGGFASAAHMDVIADKARTYHRDKIKQSRQAKGSEEPKKPSEDQKPKPSPEPTQEGADQDSQFKESAVGGKQYEEKVDEWEEMDADGANSSLYDVMIAKGTHTGPDGETTPVWKWRSVDRDTGEMHEEGGWSSDRDGVSDEAREYHQIKIGEADPYGDDDDDILPSLRGVKHRVQIITKGRGEPCKPGETAARSGCVPSKGQTGGKPASNGKPPRPSLDQAKDLIGQAGDRPSPETVQALAQHLGTMKAADLHTLKKELGVRASGPQKVLAGKIAKEATKRLTNRQKWQRQARASGIPFEALRTAARGVREVSTDYATQVQKMLQETRELHRKGTGRLLTRNHKAFRSGDLADIEGFDAIASTMAERYPELLGAGDSMVSSEKLYDFLLAGPPAMPRMKDAYQAAFNHLSTSGTVFEEGDADFEFGALAEVDEPGFTGIDAQGREWRNGELVPQVDDSGNISELPSQQPSTGQQKETILPSVADRESQATSEGGKMTQTADRVKLSPLAGQFQTSDGMNWDVLEDAFAFRPEDWEGSRTNRGRPWTAVNDDGEEIRFRLAGPDEVEVLTGEAANRIEPREVKTSRGTRHVFSWERPSKKFWNLRRAGKIPEAVSVKKIGHGEWEATIWGESPDHANEVYSQLRQMEAVR